MLHERGIPDKQVYNLLKEIHIDFSRMVAQIGPLPTELNSVSKDKFKLCGSKINSGVRQGCVLSSILFITTRDYIIVLNELTAEAKVARLFINKPKTVTMRADI